MKQVDNSASMAALVPGTFRMNVRAVISRSVTSRQSSCTKPVTIGSMRCQIMSGGTAGLDWISAGRRFARRSNRSRMAVFVARVYASSSLNCARLKRPEPAPSQVASPERRNRSMSIADKPPGAAACCAASRMH